MINTPNEKMQEPVTKQEKQKKLYKPPCFTFQRIEVPSNEAAKVKVPDHKN